MAALVPSFALESEWMLSLLQTATLAVSVFVAQALTAATVHELEAVGANINEARQNAVRAALQQSMEQLVVVDRTTADGALVRDRVLSTVNGFVRSFKLLEVVQTAPETVIRAQVVVSEADIANFIDYLDPAGGSRVDGESVFAEIERRRMQAESLRSIFRHLIQGVPAQQFQVDVLNMGPAGTHRLASGRRLSPESNAVDVIFEGGMSPDLGRSVHAFMRSVQGTREWTCADTARPVVLDWHMGSISPAWSQCSPSSSGFHEKFTACITDDGQESLHCMSMNPYFADDGHLLSLPHRFSSSRNLELYVFAFVDEMNRSTHHHQGCSLLAPGEAELPLQLQGRAGGKVFPFDNHAPGAWELTTPAFAIAQNHMLTDQQRHTYLARIDTSNVDLTRTTRLRIAQVYVHPDGTLVPNVLKRAEKMDSVCDELFGIESDGI